MADNDKIQLTENEKEELKEILSTAKKMLDGERTMMPETATVVELYPASNPIGYTSEIDMGFGERMKKCENASRLRDPLAWEMYQDIKEKIERTPEFEKMKKGMKEVSKKIRVIDRALRLCQDEKLTKSLEVQREDLKNSPVIKDYNMFLHVLECYSGVQFLSGETDKRNEQTREITYFCKEKFKINEGSTLFFDPYSRATKFSNPKKLEIEFEDFDDIVMYQRMVENKNLGKTWEEVETESVESSEYKKYVSYMPAYMQVSCDRVLDSALPNVKDRADMIFIDGVSVRERMKEEKEFKDKEPTDEEIKKYSSLYVAAALRNKSYVETFTRSIGDDNKINYKPIPITAKGENSYILKKSGTNEIEKITVGFLDRFLAKLGFKHYKEKIKNAEIADKIKSSREAFRTAHDKDMKYPLNQKAMEEKKLAFEAVHKYKDRFLDLHQKNKNFSVMQRILDDQFFPNGKKDVLNKETGYVVSCEREKLRMLAMAQMLKDGYTLEQVLDTSKYADEKAQAAQKIIHEIENCDRKTFYERHMEVTDILSAAMEEYAKDHNISFNNPESILGDPAVYLLDIATGAGNITDFMLHSKEQQEAESMFGKGIIEKIDEKTSGFLTVGMLPNYKGKVPNVFATFADGVAPDLEHFNNAVKSEVVMGILAKLETPGKVFSPNIGMLEVEAIHSMVMTHPNVEKLYKKASMEQLMDLVTKGNILKELKVDFEILPNKMMPGRPLASETLGVEVIMGNPLTAVSVVPTFNGSREYYEMDDPETVMEKAAGMEL